MIHNRYRYPVDVIQNGLGILFNVFFLLFRTRSSNLLIVNVAIGEYRGKLPTNSTAFADFPRASWTICQWKESTSSGFAIQ